MRGEGTTTFTFLVQTEIATAKAVYTTKCLRKMVPSP